MMNIYVFSVRTIDAIDLPLSTYRGRAARRCRRHPLR
jgi:hypothetical protein